MEKLTGGKIIGVDPNRPHVSIYADPARVRVGAPAAIYGNVALGALIDECSRLREGIPKPAYAKAVFREVGGKLHLLLAPEKEAGPDVYEIKWDSRYSVPVVRGLKLLFEAAKLNLQADLWYDMAPRMVEDEGLGVVLACCWTDSTTQPRLETEREVAAGSQTPENSNSGGDKE